MCGFHSVTASLSATTLVSCATASGLVAGGQRAESGAPRCAQCAPPCHKFWASWALGIWDEEFFPFRCCVVPYVSTYQLTDRIKNCGCDITNGTNAANAPIVQCDHHITFISVLHVSQHACHCHEQCQSHRHMHSSYRST